MLFFFGSNLKNHAYPGICVVVKSNLRINLNTLGLPGYYIEDTVLDHSKSLVLVYQCKYNSCGRLYVGLKKRGGSS